MSEDVIAKIKENIKAFEGMNKNLQQDFKELNLEFGHLDEIDAIIGIFKTNKARIGQLKWALNLLGDKNT